MISYNKDLLAHVIELTIQKILSSKWKVMLWLQSHETHVLQKWERIKFCMSSCWLRVILNRSCIWTDFSVQFIHCILILIFAVWAVAALQIWIFLISIVVQVDCHLSCEWVNCSSELCRATRLTLNYIIQDHQLMLNFFFCLILQRVWLCCLQLSQSFTKFIQTTMSSKESCELLIRLLISQKTSRRNNFLFNIIEF